MQGAGLRLALFRLVFDVWGLGLGHGVRGLWGSGFKKKVFTHRDFLVEGSNLDQ